MANNQRNGRVIKYKRRRNANIGVLIFVAIFIYFLIYTVMFLNRDKISVYEVVYGKTAESTNKYYEGLIIRDETVNYASAAGYLNCLVRESAKVAKGSAVYSIDQNGVLSQLLEDTLTEEGIITDSDYAEIKQLISDFSVNYQDTDFDRIYDFKVDLDATLAQLVNANQINNLLSSGNGDGTFVYTTHNSTQSGIVSYNIDGYEDKSITGLKLTDFNTENYSVTGHKSNDLIAQNAPVYKTVNNEQWDILIPLSDDDVKKYYEDTVIKIRFRQDGVTAVGDFKIIYIEGAPFGQITLEQYMIRYVSQRFVDVQIVEQQVEGLKIPKTALVNMDFFTIPERFATYGGNSQDIGFIMETYDEDGNMTVKYISPEIYEFIDGYYYVGTDEFKGGDVLVLEDMSEKYTISSKATLTGVYNVNNGYCVFRQVNILAESTDYYIIESGTSYGLLVYDHIVLDSATVEENQVVYH